jgi:2-isopropylmalate synthase
VVVQCGTQARATATVRLRNPEGAVVETTELGDGPVDATFLALRHLTGIDAELVDFSIQAVTHGTDALGEATVRLHQVETGRFFAAHGTDTDIVVAAARAYLHACNRCLAAEDVAPLTAAQGV